MGEKADPKTNGGAAYEMRVRIHSSAYWYYYLWHTSDSGGPYRRLNVYFTGVANHEDSAPPGVDAQTGYNSPPAWTIIRVVNDNTTVSIFTDGSLDAQYTVDGTDDPRTEYYTRMLWNGTVDVDLDYVRWTDGEPAPPKGALVLIK